MSLPQLPQLRIAAWQGDWSARLNARIVIHGSYIFLGTGVKSPLIHCVYNSLLTSLECMLGLHLTSIKNDESYAGSDNYLSDPRIYHILLGHSAVNGNPLFPTLHD